MAISPIGMANMNYWGFLPMGMANYGGDIQIYNVPEYSNSQVGLIFNPQAQAQLGGTGGFSGVPQLNLNIDVDALANAMFAPVIENLALSNVNSNNSTIAGLKTRLNALAESQGISNSDKNEINKLLKELEQQEQAMKALEDESLTNQDIFDKSKEISKKITEISKKASKISSSSTTVTSYANESQGFASSSYSTNSINSTGSKGRAALSSSEYGPKFLEKVKQIAQRINCDYKDLLALMNSESGINAHQWCTVPGEENKAVGLIQFREETAKDLGTSLQALSTMSPIKQLDYVEKYFKMWINTKGINGQRLSAADLYTLTYLPKYFRQQTISRAGEARYEKNKGLDVNGDKRITQSDLAQQITRKRVSDNSFYA